MMFYLTSFVIIFSFLLQWTHCHVIWDTPNSLQPVHGLYVKPSIDGTTGDLYVAASEDNGVKSQWLTDQPVNFLSASTQNQPKAVPVFTSSLTKTSTPSEETITSQKRAVITSPTVRYAYALPVPGAEGNFVAPYPYAIPANLGVEGSNIPSCHSDSPAQPYPPFPYFYPPMMSALSNAMNILKEGDTDGGSKNITPLTPPYWPHTYGYPYQYIMVDPNAWAQNQSGTLTSTTTSSTSSENS